MGAIQLTPTGFGELDLNRRRQQIVIFRRLGFGQAVFASLQARKCRGGEISICVLKHRLTVSIGNADLRRETIIDIRTVLVQLFQLKLNTRQRLILLVCRFFKDVQVKLRVQPRVGQRDGAVLGRCATGHFVNMAVQKQCAICCCRDKSIVRVQRAFHDLILVDAVRIVLHMLIQAGKDAAPAS